MHVQAVVHLIVDTELLVNAFSTVAFHLREFGRFMFVDALDDVLGHGIRCISRVVCNDIGLRSQVLSFETPADLTRYPWLEVYDRAFVIEGFL